jgi:hypothetical protein
MSKDKRQYNQISLLKAKFPGYGNRIDQLYTQDSVFRQVAREYCECVRKQEEEIPETSKVYAFYEDTIRELKEELLEHLK